MPTGHSGSWSSSCHVERVGEHVRWKEGMIVRIKRGHTNSLLARWRRELRVRFGAGGMNHNWRWRAYDEALVEGLKIEGCVSIPPVGASRGLARGRLIGRGNGGRHFGWSGVGRGWD